MPFLGNKNILSEDIAQLYSKERISRNRKGTNISYAVHAILKNGKNIKLLTSLSSSEQALAIEREIEKYLSIEDQDVKGAIG